MWVKLYLTQKFQINMATTNYNSSAKLKLTDDILIIVRKMPYILNFLIIFYRGDNTRFVPTHISEQCRCSFSEI